MTHPDHQPQDPDPKSYTPHSGGEPNPSVERRPRDPSDPLAYERERLRQEEAHGAGVQRFVVARKLSQTVIYLVSALQLLLGLRFLLRLTAANPDNDFANFIDSLSNPFAAPFANLFVSPTTNGDVHIFDVNVLVAMLAYLVLMFLALWLIRIFLGR